jgi:hypothetical protein
MGIQYDREGRIASAALVQLKCLSSRRAESGVPNSHRGGSLPEALAPADARSMTAGMTHGGAGRPAIRPRHSRLDACGRGTTVGFLRSAPRWPDVDTA